MPPLWQKLTHILLPQDCLLCGDPAGAGSDSEPDSGPLCPACRDILPRAPAECCPICALPGSTTGPCGACLKNPPHYDATLASLMYAFPVDRLIKMLKYQHRLPVANLLAGMMLPAALISVDVLVPVPLSSSRLRERGFNQAQELARVLGRALGRPVEPDTCHRVVDTTPQAALAWSQRHKNIRNAFECTQDFSGRHVVLVDDVMTTGATLDELARTLKLHGASRVTNWVAARTDRHRGHR